MKIKTGFLLSEVAGKTYAVAVGERSREFRGMISLNDTAKFLWEKLKDDTTAEELVAALLSEYEVDEETAKESVKEFLSELQEAGILEQ